jgi:hypothetical protein
MVLVLHYNDTFFICHTYNYGCQIYTLWWPNYICNIYIYILKIFYGVNKGVISATEE